MNANLYPLIAAAASAAAKSGVAASQRRSAKKLKESKWIPEELMMNKDLAQLQAYSREAPGKAKAEENIRRSQANTLSAIQKTAGGDTGKIAAASVASQQAATDALDQVNVRGQQFSENALNNVRTSNVQIAQQKMRNRDEFNRAKTDLLAASDENYMRAFNDILDGAMASAYMGGGDGTGSGRRVPRSQAPKGIKGFDVMATDEYGRFTPSKYGENPIYTWK